MVQESLPNVIECENAAVDSQLRDRRSLKAYIYALMAFKQGRSVLSKVSQEDIKEQVIDQGEDAPRTVSILCKDYDQNDSSGFIHDNTH
jgi:hypothetical protein